ncbi:MULTISPECIES: hypothetical protein [Streptomyces]|uniref:hypothetical protein n=1 Tax=Streptomyces TaxID=1883 RepID=UPI00345C3A72
MMVRVNEGAKGVSEMLSSARLTQRFQFPERRVGSTTDKLLWFRAKALQSLLRDLANAEHRGFGREVCRAVHRTLNLIHVEFSDLDNLGQWLAPPGARMRKIRDYYDEWNNVPKSARDRCQILDEIVEIKNDLKDALGSDRSLILQHDDVDAVVDESIRHLQTLSEDYPRNFREVQTMTNQYHKRFLR